MNEKDTYNELTRKGLEACNTVRTLHNQPAIKFDKSTPVFVHKSCRKRWVNSKYISATEKRRKDDANVDEVCTAVKETQPSDNIRCKTKTYQAGNDCILCGNLVDDVCARKHPGQANYQFSKVEKLTFCERLKEKCKERNCPWSSNIMDRIYLILHDFVAEEVLYQRVCHRALFNNCEKPELIRVGLSSPPPKKPKIGKTEDIEKMKALGFAID